MRRTSTSIAVTRLQVPYQFVVVRIVVLCVFVWVSLSELFEQISNDGRQDVNL